MALKQPSDHGSRPQGMPCGAVWVVWFFQA
jgi:hypothetical protein